MRYQAAALLLLFAACEGPMEPDDRWAVPEEIEFAAALEIDLDSMNRTQSGLYWEDLVPGPAGSRSVVVEDEVLLHYTIWLPDGEDVETTAGGTPFQSDVRGLIKGVGEGIVGMRPGGVRRLVIRPELAWPNGHNAIPALTTIVFQMELVGILDD